MSSPLNFDDSPAGRRAPVPVASSERLLALQAAPLPRQSDVNAGAANAAWSPSPASPHAPARGAPSAALFDQWPDALLRFDATGTVVYANAAIERATAISRHAFAGRRLAEIDAFAPFAPLWDEAIAATLETLQPRLFKFVYPHPTGDKRFDVTLLLEPAGDGGAAAVTAMLRDATAPRHALRAQRAADELVTTVMDGAQIGLAVLDTELRYVRCNAYLERLLGVGAAALRGRRPDEVFAGAAAPEGMSVLQAMRAGAVRDTQVVEYQFPGGQRPWLRERRTPLFDTRGRFDGVFVAAERIDRERFAEISLAALRNALDAVNEIVLQIDRAGHVLDANRTTLAWLGYEREQLRGLTIGSIDARLGGALLARVLDDVTRLGALRSETNYRTRTGGELAVDVLFQRVEHGGREFFFLLARDISERKRLAQALADSAGRMAAIFDESPVAKLVLDQSLRIRQVNHAAVTLTGFAVDELIGRDPATLLHPDDAAAFETVRARVAGGVRSSDEIDCRVVRRDGIQMWVKWSARTVATPAGGRLLFVLEDFTERKVFEQQLKVVLREQQTLLETMSVGVVQALDSKVLLANREFARMFGFDDGEVIGMSLWDLCRDDDPRNGDDVSGLPVVRPAQTSSAQVVLYGRDGNPRWCLVQARFIERGADEATGAAREAIYTFQDISQLKQQRESLTRSLLELNVVLDATSVAVLYLDSAQRIQRVNAPAYALFADRGGADANDADPSVADPGVADTSIRLIGRPLSTLFATVGDEAPPRLGVPVALGAAEPQSFELRMRGGDGQPFWAWVTVREAAPQFEGLIVSVLNVDQRKGQEERLQTLLTESRLIFDTALVGLLFVRDSRPVRANAAMEELLGCDPGALVSQMQLFSHPTDQLLAASLARHYADIDEEGACEFEMHMFRRRGDPIWVAVQGRAVNPDRTDLGYIFAFVNIDQRKRSERELRATLNELQLIFDNALVGMIYVASDLVVKANAATERLFGYDQRDLRELQMASFFADGGGWASVQEVLAERDGARAAGAPVAFEQLMKRADGTTFWCAGSVRPLDRAAPDRGIIVTLMDVDVRRRSEDELRQVRNYLNLIVENLPVLVAVRDAADGRFISMNRAGETLTGFARHQVVGRTWEELYEPGFASRHAALDRQAIRSLQQIERPRDTWVRADGRTLTVSQRVVPLVEARDEAEVAASDAAGAAPVPAAPAEVLYVMSIVDDLTDEVRTESALRETEARFRQFAENIDQLVFIASVDLTSLSYVNNRCEPLLGVVAAEVQADPLLALAAVHPDDRVRLQRALPRVVARLRRLRKTELSAKVEHAQGGVRLLNLRLNPVRTADGTVRVFGIADDVTERAAAEEQRLQEAVKQRDILVREVHHRIKNNLQGVAGLLQHMANSKPEVAPTLNDIAGQIQAIAQVHGLQIRATGTLPVLGVVQGIFSTLAAMFGVDIRVETPPPTLWRWGLPENEAVPLALVINELGTNAIKYRASRDQAIDVRLEPLTDGVVIRLTNTGQLKAGFDFGRIDSGVSGLSLVKALLPRRGARLAIEQSGAAVVTSLALTPPAISEDRG